MHLVLHLREELLETFLYFALKLQSLEPLFPVVRSLTQVLRVSLEIHHHVWIQKAFIRP